MTTNGANREFELPVDGLDAPELQIAAGDLAALDLDPADPIVGASPELIEALAISQPEDALSEESIEDDREVLLAAHHGISQLLEEASDAIQEFDPDDESDEATELREREQSLYAAEWALRDAYRESIPAVPLSRCPFTAAIVRAFAGRGRPRRSLVALRRHGEA